MFPFTVIYFLVRDCNNSRCYCATSVKFMIFNNVLPYHALLYERCMHVVFLVCFSVQHFFVLYFLFGKSVVCIMIFWNQINWYT